MEPVDKEPVEFERVVVSRRQEGELLIALFDGARKKGTPHEFVDLLCCSDDVARALVNALLSALERSIM